MKSSLDRKNQRGPQSADSTMMMIDDAAVGGFLVLSLFWYDDVAGSNRCSNMDMYVASVHIFTSKECPADEGGSLPNSSQPTTLVFDAHAAVDPQHS